MVSSNGTAIFFHCLAEAALAIEGEDMPMVERAMEAAVVMADLDTKERRSSSPTDDIQRVTDAPLLLVHCMFWLGENAKTP